MFPVGLCFSEGLSGDVSKRKAVVADRVSISVLSSAGHSAGLLFTFANIFGDDQASGCTEERSGPGSKSPM